MFARGIIELVAPTVRLHTRHHSRLHCYEIFFWTGMQSVTHWDAICYPLRQRSRQAGPCDSFLRNLFPASGSQAGPADLKNTNGSHVSIRWKGLFPYKMLINIFLTSSAWKGRSVRGNVKFKASQS